MSDPARRRPEHSPFIDVSGDEDAFLAFRTELSSRIATKSAGGAGNFRRFRVRWVVAPLLLTPFAAGMIAWLERPNPATVATGRTVATRPAATATESPITIRSHPQGAAVFIDGVRKGITPLEFTLAVGQHTIELRNGAASRKLPLDVEPGVAVTQYIEIESPGTIPVDVGSLEVLTDPPGAEVAIDGVARGVTPLSVSDLPVGQHRVTLTSRNGTFNRRVTVAPGTTATVVASLAPATVSVGWIVFESPLDLQVFEDGKRLGTVLDRIMLPAGAHTLDLVNDQYGYRTTTNVDVQAGETVTTKIDIPIGRISINATPWAEVLIDGRHVGITPLGHLEVPIGTHEIVWRHPRLGERRQVVSVTAEQPVRIGMDFGQKDR